MISGRMGFDLQEEIILDIAKLIGYTKVQISQRWQNPCAGNNVNQFLTNFQEQS